MSEYGIGQNIQTRATLPQDLHALRPQVPWKVCGPSQRVLARAPVKAAQVPFIYSCHPERTEEKEELMMFIRK